MSKTPTVVLVTHSNDNESIALITAALEARGARALRFDTDRYPTAVQLSVSEGEGTPPSEIRTPDGRVTLEDVTAVWWRRTAYGADIPKDIERQMRAACVEESKRVLLGAFAGRGIFTLDPENVIRRAECKPHELRVAREVGLEVPRTISTNDPDAVRAFAATCPGGIITKMMASFAIYDAAGRENVVFTNRVKPEDLDDLEGLALCPMTFQEAVPKALELRATVVGDRVLTASIDSQRVGRARDDWRREGAAMVGDWQPYTLPADVSDKLLRYMDRFGLNYGAADFIVTPEGRHIFLEVNPAGEWFWLQLAPGLPIADALADVLLGLAPRRGGAW